MDDSDKFELAPLSSRTLINELIRRGWRLGWACGSDSSKGNLELEGPEQDLGPSLERDHATALLDE